MSPSPSPSFPLLSLPNELIATIITDHLSDRSALIALAQTCRKLQILAEARLFRDIYIRKGSPVPRLAYALNQRPERFRYVKHVEVTPGQYMRTGIEGMPRLLRQMKRLKRLKVEAPMINSRTTPKWWTKGSEGVVGYMSPFKRGVFECLTDFTFHSHGTGNRYYTIETVLPIVLSQTLKRIHLSCINMGSSSDSIAKLAPHTASTPLQTLILERCITFDHAPSILPALLALPRALTSLTLIFDTTLAAAEGLPASPLPEEASPILSAIAQQRDSLSYLRLSHTPAATNHVLDHAGLPALATHYNNTTPPLPHPGLSLFKKLHALALEHYSPLVSFLFSPALSPPKLRQLHLSGLDYTFSTSFAHLPPLLTAIAHGTVSLEGIALRTCPARQALDDVAQIFTSAVFTHTEYRDVLVRAAEALGGLQEGRRKVRLRVVCSEKRGYVFAPFLWGERMPGEGVFFDSKGGDARSGLKGKVGGEGEGEGDEAEDGDVVDRRFEVRICEGGVETEGEGDLSGWEGPFFGLGNRMGC